MISVGIDVSKGKSTVCILKPYGEVIKSPYEINHTETNLLNLTNTILTLMKKQRL
jgi:transposase